ncbi:hypothetical protein P23_1071 [Acinetobacter calcoaceticus]|uniref:carboxymuconolactone decarboxylase family protein n=1 Tax=Acinetobacter calcoaceticus TaxID=471 RepID=UPI00058369A4|nr:carboxymuconolactone decarboxylase family protein [Acinetobacter calcoaceticus]GAM30568.1 hypothetical protein P23_1071 [Acinetobacter calcoaceticus]
MATDLVQQLTPKDGWCEPGNKRFTLVNPENAKKSQKILLSGLRHLGKLDAENLWRLLLINPRMMQGVLFFSSKLMPYGELPRRDTELVILRVGWNCRARYEWGQHVDIGMRAGLTPIEIARIPHGAEADGWLPKQHILLKACDEFHSERMISDLTWNQLAEHYDQRLLLELLMLIGYYEGLAGVLNSAGLPLDTGIEEILAFAPIHR